MKDRRGEKGKTMFAHLAIYATGYVMPKPISTGLLDGQDAQELDR